MPPRQALLFETQARPLLEPVAAPGDLDPLPLERPARPQVATETASSEPRTDAMLPSTLQEFNETFLGQPVDVIRSYWESVWPKLSSEQRRSVSAKLRGWGVDWRAGRKLGHNISLLIDHLHRSQDVPGRLRSLGNLIASHEDDLGEGPDAPKAVQEARDNLRKQIWQEYGDINLPDWAVPKWLVYPAEATTDIEDILRKAYGERLEAPEPHLTCHRCGKPVGGGRLYCPACRAWLERDRDRFTRRLAKTRLPDTTQELF